MPDFLGPGGWSEALSALIIGTLLGMAYGVIPGIGGRLGILLSIPVATLFHPYGAAILLFAMHSVIHTSTSIPAIAFGLPTSGSDAATVVDGYPLARMGRGGEALGASLSASAIGGVLGAIAFLVAIPVARPLVTNFGPPEFFMLAVLGMTMVASLSREGLLPGLAVACIGILFAMVGPGIAAAEPRFTFGFLDLWGGVSLPALVCGLFVVPEMLTMRPRTDEIAHTRAVGTSLSDVFRGMFVTFKHKAVVLRSSLYGIIVGLTPAVGSSVSVWMSYGYAAQTTKSEIPFGKGAIAGVIAPEAANNSKEGGAMIPTLFFGIPGSSSMAIMMAALGYVGIEAGPDFLKRDLGLSYTLAATIFLANLIAVPIFFAIVPSIVRLSALRREAIVPIAIALSVMAAFIASPRLTTLFQVIVASILGLTLKYAGWPRAPFILGLVLGKMAETAFHQTAIIWGWSAVFRPLTALLLAFLVLWLAYIVWTRPITKLPGTRATTLAVATGLAAVFSAAIVLSSRLQGASAVVPTGAAVAGLAFCALTALSAFLRHAGGEPLQPVRHLPFYAAYVALTPFIGLIAASIAFVTGVMVVERFRWRVALATGLALGAAQWAILSLLFDVLVEKEIVGRLAWSWLGY